jgi:hypothetical protein
VLLLLHDTGWPNAEVWQAWAARHPPGAVSLHAHLQAGAKVSRGRTPGLAAIQQHQLHTRVRSRWGDTSLVQVSGDAGVGCEHKGRGGMWPAQSPAADLITHTYHI